MSGGWSAIPVSSGSFERLTAPLVGKSLSRPWAGSEAVLYSEVGRLRRGKIDARATEGAYRVGFGYDWRVEGPGYMAIESSSPKGRLRRDIQALKNLVIAKVTVVGELPELVVGLTCGLSIWTLCREASPAWSVRLPDGTWLGVKGGQLVHNVKVIAA